MPRKRPPPASKGGLTFVVATDLQKPDLSTRKFIRSHVMLGKNAGRVLSQRRKKPSPVPDVDEVDDIEHAEEIALSPASRRFITKRSVLPPAVDIEPSKINAILQFSAIAKQVLFPLEPCIFFENRAEEWIGPLSTDPAYLHCLIFTSQYFFDAKLAKSRGSDVPINRDTMSHFVKGIRMLSDRMSSNRDSMQLSNATAAAVMGLSSYALVTCDLVFAERHMLGLQKIVTLRGGFKTFFGGSEKLLVEILRSDLGLALARGSQPMFLDMLLQDPLIEVPDINGLLLDNGSHVSNALPRCLKAVDDRVSEIWCSLASFTALIEFAAASQQKMSTSMYLESMTSTLYRLVSFALPQQALDELLRLALLMFACSAFLQWRTCGMPYTQLAIDFRKTLSAVDSTDLDPEFELWLILIAGIAVLEESDQIQLEARFRRCLLACHADSWLDVREIARAFLWIPLIHDRPGQQLYAFLLPQS